MGRAIHNAGVLRCIAWTFLNSPRLGGDPDRLALLGDSAGGNLAVNEGFRAAAGVTSSHCGPKRFAFAPDRPWCASPMPTADSLVILSAKTPELS
ncbi:MAG: alpha/beta hydrolase fold domain-containing protein [Roseinatronobacter sp.]